MTYDQMGVLFVSMHLHQKIKLPSYFSIGELLPRFFFALFMNNLIFSHSMKGNQLFKYQIDTQMIFHPVRIFVDFLCPSHRREARRPFFSGVSSVFICRTRRIWFRFYAKMRQNLRYSKMGVAGIEISIGDIHNSCNHYFKIGT